MIGPIIAIAAMAAPSGYLAGDVYREKNNGPDWLPYASAALLPLALVLAATLITQVNNGERK